jgi:hypothetical protein
MTVVIQAGHENINANCDPARHGETGAPGEIEWTPQVADLIVARLHAANVAARHVDANFNCASDVHHDYEAVVAVHYQSDPPHVSGFFCGVGDPSQDGNAAGSHRLQQAITDAYRTATGLVVRPEWNNDNITGYYLFASLSGPTPFALIECGTGAPGAPDHDLLHGQVDKVAGGIAEGILAFLGHPVTQPCPGGTHVVQHGDTMASIARQFGVDLHALEQANPALERGHNWNLIVPGDIVCIP